MLKKTIKIAKFLIIGLLLLFLVLPAGAGHAKSHKSRGRSVGATHSYVYKTKKASKSYRASNSGSRSGRKTRVSYRPKARVTRHKSAPKRKSYPRKSIPKRMHAASPRKAKPRVKPKHPTRHASHKAKPKHKATPKHKNKKASKSKAKASKKHSTPKKKQSFLGKLWTSAKKKVKTAVHKGQKFVKKVKKAVHKVAKKVRKVVHYAVKAVSKAAKTVKKFVQKHSTAIFTGLSVAAVVLSFTPLAPLGIAMDAGLTAWSAYNAISGKDLLSGAHLSNGARIGYGVGVLASVAGPLVGKLIGKGLNKLAETPQVSKMLGKLSNGTEFLKASRAGQVASKLSGSFKNLSSKVSESGAGKALSKASSAFVKPLNKANEAYEGAAEKIKGLFAKATKNNAEKDVDRNVSEFASKQSRLSFKIGESDGGPGSWENRATPEKGASYQEKVAGAPKDTEYVVKTSQMSSGEKKFDGYNPKTNTLIDAKDYKTGSDGFPPTGKGKFTVMMENKVIKEAKHDAQIANEAGSKLEWHVPTQEKANQLQKLFDKNKINIHVVVNPK